MPSPVSAEHYGEPHFDFVTWLGVYRAHTPQVRGGDNATLRLDLDDEPQPDVYLRLLPECGGQAWLVDGYVTAPPPQPPDDEEAQAILPSTCIHCAAIFSSQKRFIFHRVFERK